MIRISTRHRWSSRARRGKRAGAAVMVAATLVIAGSVASPVSAEPVMAPPHNDPYIAAPAPNTVPCATNELIVFGGLLCHTVQPGEWLWQIARAGRTSTSPSVCPTDDVHVIARRVRTIVAANRRVLRGNPQPPSPRHGPRRWTVERRHHHQPAVRGVGRPVAIGSRCRRTVVSPGSTW
jgi:hypothetical protein